MERVRSLCVVSVTRQQPVCVLFSLCCVLSGLTRIMDSSLLHSHITVGTKTTESLDNSSALTVSKGELKVPNIVHYVWYTARRVRFRFDKALSVLSAIKTIQPQVVYFHTNKEPYGPYFQMLKKMSVFKVIHREPPRSVIKPHQATDYSNYDRVKIIHETGGIYMDLDVMVTRPFDDLRRYDCTLGYEDVNRVCGGVIVCVKKHTFLYLWLNAYFEDFRPKWWSYNSGVVPSRLIARFPELVHIEKAKIHRPNYREVHKIWGTTPYPWRDNYAIHTWIRVALKANLTDYPTPESIKTMNSTYGQIARYVYYGSIDMINT